MLSLDEIMLKINFQVTNTDTGSEKICDGAKLKDWIFNDAHFTDVNEVIMLDSLDQPNDVSLFVSIFHKLTTDIGHLPPPKVVYEIYKHVIEQPDSQFIIGIIKHKKTE